MTTPPTDSGPTDPGPTDPGPTDPGPTDSGPTTSGPTTSAPTPSALSRLSLDDLRREAKRFHRAWSAGDAWALTRVRQHPPKTDPAQLRRADFLHILARERGFASWPALKLAADTLGFDRAEALQQLKIAMAQGNMPMAERLLDRFPDLADGVFGLECALYRRDAVAAALARDPGLATRTIGPRSPMVMLVFSRWIKIRPELAPDMLAVAEMLHAHGADVNDGYPFTPGDPHLLSALYGAIGHADNMVLGRWLLEQGANPNDGESLYHATELGHRDGLRMLLEFGADPNGTNALFRAMDFNDHESVQLLLDHGARIDDFNGDPVGGELPVVIPALHQAARRGCDARMAALILAAGADPDARWKGTSAQEMARIFGNNALVAAIRDAGGDMTVAPDVAPLVAAAETREGPWIDPALLPLAYADLLRDMVHLPHALPVMRALVARGLPYDKPDAHEKITPTHVAGWSGLPEVLAWLLSLRPDLSFVNGHGGTLLSTILHGSENNPDRAKPGRDYLACLDLALHQGVALPRREIGFAAREDVRAFLEDWAETHPGQVV